MSNPCDGYNYNGKFFADKESFMEYLNGEGRKTLEEDIKIVNTSKKTETVGVSHKALTSSAKDIGIEAPKRGKGSTREGREARAEELSANLEEANKLVNEFIENKKKLESEGRADEVSANPKQVAAGKAILSDLNKQRDEARDLGDKLGVEELNKKIHEQHKISKQIATASHMVFAEHQGELSLNTDSESAMESAAEGKSNTQLTEKQREEARAKAKKSKETGDELEKLSDEWNEEIEKKTKGVKSKIENPREHFSSKDSNDVNFTLEEVKTVWNVFKGHLDSQKSLAEAYKNTMVELGLNRNQITHAIALPKTKGRNITTEMSIANARRRKAVEAAKNYIKDLNSSKTVKFLNKIWRLPAAIYTTGHGFTAPITHAILMLFRNPKTIGSYLKFIKNTYRFGAGGVFSKEIRAEYEDTMTNMEIDPLFGVALKSGVSCDRGVDYTSEEQINKYLNLKERMQVGQRGFDMLKPYRFELFKKAYENLTLEERENQAILESIARDINMGTGTFKFKTKDGKAADIVFDKVFWSFKLQASRVGYTFLDPIKTISSLATSRWKELTPEQKHQNKLVLNRTGWLLASGFSSLLANQALLSAVGSKDNVNFSDPDKDDWLAYKVNGQSIPLLKTPLFVYKMIAASIKNHIKGGVDVDDNDADIILREIRYKIDPTLGIVWELKTGTNAIGQANPFTKNEKAMSRITEENPRLTWGQYIAQHGPIPISEAEKGMTERMREEGMSDKEIVGFLNNFLHYGEKTLKTGKDIGLALTGIRVSDAKTNKRLFDNGNIPSRETQREIYKTGTQTERNYLDKNISENINEEIENLYESEFEKQPEGKGREVSAAVKAVKELFKKGGKRSELLKTYDILPSEIDKYTQTILKQKIFDKRIEDGNLSEEAKKYSEMTKQNVNDAFSQKLRDISNIKNIESRKLKVSKLIPLIQELYSLGKIDKQMMSDFVILSVKGSYVMKE